MSKPPPVRFADAATQLDAEVVVEDERWRKLDNVERLIADAAQALWSRRRDLFETSARVTILLSDDAHVAALNGTFRSKPVPTNVLSFPAGSMAADDGAPAYLGDIILAFDTVAREAGEQDIPVSHHIQHLTIHGLLHLLGFDHLTDDDATAMETIETAVLVTLGVPDPYAPELFEQVSKT